MARDNRVICVAITVGVLHVLTLSALRSVNLVQSQVTTHVSGARLAIIISCLCTNTVSDWLTVHKEQHDRYGVYRRKNMVLYAFVSFTLLPLSVRMILVPYFSFNVLEL